MDNQNNEEDDDENGGFYFPQRYMATLLALVTLCHGFFCRSAFYVAMDTIMEGKTKESNATINCQHLEEDDRYRDDPSQMYHGVHYDWDSDMTETALNFYNYTYIGAHIFAGYLSDRYGAKLIVAVSIAGSSFTALFIPIMIDKTQGEIFVVYIAYFATGFFHSFLLPGIATFLSHWIPKTERARLCSIAFSGMFFGIGIKNVVTRPLITKLDDWTVPCYVYGGIGIVVFIFWWFYAYSDPSSNPNVLTTERKYLETVMKEIVDHRKKKVPLIKIFLSLEVWALVFGSFGHLWLYHFALGFLRKYMHNVLHFSISHSRIWSAIPYLAMIISSCVNGFVSDWILKNDYVNLSTLRKAYTNIGTMGPAIYVTVASFATCHRDVFKAMFIIANTLGGCVFSGIRLVPMDIAPNYAGVLTALTNAVGLTNPLFMDELFRAVAPHRTIEGYRSIFFVTVGVAGVCNAIFVICARIKLQEWNTPIQIKEKHK